MAATAVAPVAVADVGDLPAGGTLSVTVGGRQVVVADLDGTLVAVDGRCSHAAGPLGTGTIVDGCRLQCPWHGSTFDLATGEVCTGPARKALARHAVHVADGKVMVTLTSAAPAWSGAPQAGSGSSAAPPHSPE